MFLSRSQDFFLSLFKISPHIAKFVQKPLVRVVSHPRTKGAQFANGQSGWDVTLGCGQLCAGHHLIWSVPFVFLCFIKPILGVTAICLIYHFLRFLVFGLLCYL